MKKYTMFLLGLALVFGFFSFNVNLVDAQTVIITFPPGCTSHSGYSSTTGQPCSTTTSPPGCLPGYLFSPVTGQPCNTSFPPGCTSYVGYSSTTGQRCGPETGGLDPNPGSLPFISSVLPAGCPAQDEYSTITSLPCTSAAFGNRVYVNGSNFNSSSSIFLDNGSYSPVNGVDRLIIPATFISSNRLSFIVPSNAGAGVHKIQVNNRTSSSPLLSNAVNFNFISSTTTINNNPPRITSVPSISTNMRHGETITLSWSATDADNDNLFWAVNWGDGTPMMAYDCPLQARQNGQNKTFSASHIGVVGEYRAKVTVADCRGGEDTHSFGISFKQAARPELTLVSPAHGEHLKVGTSYEIILDSVSAPAGAKLDIALTNYNGGLISYMVQNLGPISGRRSWVFTTPSVPGSYWLFARLHDGQAVPSSMEHVITDDMNLIFVEDSSDCERWDQCGVDGGGGLGASAIMGLNSASQPASPVSPASSASSQVQTATSFRFTKFLEEGARGGEVMELQKYLSLSGYYSGNIDGVFGPKLKEALIKFQTENKLKADGIMGYEVRTLLNK